MAEGRELGIGGLPARNRSRENHHIGVRIEL